MPTFEEVQLQIPLNHVVKTYRKWRFLVCDRFTVIDFVGQSPVFCSSTLLLRLFQVRQVIVVGALTMAMHWPCK